MISSTASAPQLSAVTDKLSGKLDGLGFAVLTMDGRRRPGTYIGFGHSERGVQELDRKSRHRILEDFPVQVMWTLPCLPVDFSSMQLLLIVVLQGCQQVARTARDILSSYCMMQYYY